MLTATARGPSDTSSSTKPTRDPLAGLAAAFAKLQQAIGPHLRLQQSGANRHAIGAEDSMRARAGVGIVERNSTNSASPARASCSRA